MSGEISLRVLLGSMRPDLVPGVFVFVTLAAGIPVPPGIDPVMSFREREGRTLIVAEHEARAAGLPATFRCRMITLNIHSALEAVGFLAAILPALAAASMGVNPVSAFYHDHLFVPVDRADDAMAILEQIADQHTPLRR